MQPRQNSRVLFAAFWICISMYYITAAAVNHRGGGIWASISQFQQAWKTDWRYGARLWRDGVIAILCLGSTQSWAHINSSNITLNPHYSTLQYHGQLIPQVNRLSGHRPILTTNVLLDNLNLTPSNSTVDKLPILRPTLVQYRFTHLQASSSTTLLCITINCSS